MGHYLYYTTLVQVNSEVMITFIRDQKLSLIKNRNIVCQAGNLDW